MNTSAAPLVALDPSKDEAFEALVRAMPGRQQDWAEIWTNWARAGELQRAKWVKAAELVGPGDPSATPAAQLNSFGATWELVRQLRADRARGLARVYLNPAGGDYADDQLLDAAWAAKHLFEAELNVAYLDLAAEPGARTLELLETWEISARTLELGPGAGDLGLFKELSSVLEQLPEDLDVLLLGAGADGLWSDNSSSWEFTVEGMGAAALQIGQFAAARGASVLVLGGRGSDEAPQQWLHVVAALSSSFVFSGVDTLLVSE